MEKVLEKKARLCLFCKQLTSQQQAACECRSLVHALSMKAKTGGLGAFVKNLEERRRTTLPRFQTGSGSSGESHMFPSE